MERPVHAQHVAEDELLLFLTLHPFHFGAFPTITFGFPREGYSLP